MMMYILRIMGDLTFFYAFAGGISGCFSGNGLMIPMIIQSVCFGLSMKVKSKILKVLTLIPMVLGFVLPGFMWADWVVIALGSIYVIYLNLSTNHTKVSAVSYLSKGLMSWSAQVDKFRLFIKIYPIFAVLMILVGFYSNIVQVSVPMAIVSVMVSVLLMRALRHEPQVYMQKKYMLINGITVVLTLIAAGLITLRPVVEAFLKGILWLYRTLIAPILIGIAWILGYAMSYVAAFFSWLAKQLGGTREVMGQMNDVGPPEAILQEIESAGGTGDFIVDVLRAVVIIVGLVIVVKLFLWLGRKQQVEEYGLVQTHRKNVTPSLKESRIEKNGSGNIWQVRRWYRRFMELYEQKITKVHPSNTTAEIEKRALYSWKDQALLDELREIYIRARYGHMAERADVKRIKELYLQLKKDMNGKSQ